MDKRVILAVAGSGKTYYICHKINPYKKNLILAYTHENINNILSELINAYGEIPKLTTVMTFDAFKYRLLLKPYEYNILSCVENTVPITKGITMQESPKATIAKNGKHIPNPKYVTKNKIKHYLNDNQLYYCDKIAELLLINKKLMNYILKNINRFFDCIYVDEFQDYRKYDYELMILLSKNIDNILLVGDYYQHSVSGMNNSGKPFANRKKSISYIDFVEELKNKGLIVDTNTLNCSRRCSVQVCDFIRDKLNIEIHGNDQRNGDIEIINNLDEVKKVVDDDSIVKLVFNRSSKYSFNAVNWSYSKGDTMENVCVILTKSTDDIIKDNFHSDSLPLITKNKLYVALTRSRGNVYLITSKLFENYKKQMNIQFK